jgi:acyl-CoA synthetase (AMP-forming)/AMP-acid ligase II
VRYSVRRQTYGGLDTATAAFVAHLASLGFERGDRVAIFMKNGLLYPAALLGAFRGGFVAVPINAKLHPRAAAFIVENAEPKVVLVDNGLVHEFAAAAGSATPPRPSSSRLAPTALWKKRSDGLRQLRRRRPTARRTTPRGCFMPQAPPDAQKARCSAIAISSRWR